MTEKPKYVNTACNLNSIIVVIKVITVIKPKDEALSTGFVSVERVWNTICIENM